MTEEELVELANLLISFKSPLVLRCNYANYRAVVSEREFTPKEVWYGSTEWHPEPCLLLKAFDHGKKAMRDFKLADFDHKTMRIEGDQS